MSAPIDEFEALKRDVLQLFQRFCRRESVRFEEFAGAWAELNFTAVFGCTERSTDTAKMRVAERLFRIASEFLSADAAFLYRVAAVYCLYAVYFKQVVLPRVKIRMTPTMWKDLMEFLDIVTTHQHLDVAFVIQKLRLSKAFVFTAMPKHLTFGRQEFMLGVDGAPSCRRAHEKDKYIEELVVQRGITRSLSNVQAEYSEVRARLLAESQSDELSDLKKNLCMSHDDFTEELDKLLDSYTGQQHASSLRKPSELTATQRPVLTIPSSTPDLINTEENAEDSGSSPVVGKQRAGRIKQLKESAFSATASKTGAGVDEPVVPQKRTYYRRSAMLEPYQQGAWAKTRRAKHPTYSLKNEKEGDEETNNVLMEE